MKILKGTAISSGLARGTVCLYSNEPDNSPPHYGISPEQIPDELERLKKSLESAKDEMKEVIKVARAHLDKKAADIFNTHFLLLNDQGLFQKMADLIKNRRINAEHAVTDIFEEYIKKYDQAEEHFKELTHDFIDTRNRILKAFNVETSKFKCPRGGKEPLVVAAKRLTPSMVLGLSRENVLAFVTEEGGVTSHATILARSYGVPIVMGIEVEKELDCGMGVIVNGSLGRVIIKPDKKTSQYYDRKFASLERKKGYCAVRTEHFPQTKGGARIQLKLNISTPNEFTLVTGFPHDGVGLLRTEFLFMQSNAVLSEEEQYKMYKRILQEETDQPVTVRLLDIGNDKLPLYFKVPEKMNLDLSLRGAMVVETFPKIYLTQLRALLRANSKGNLRLLYPMVSDLADLKTFRAILKQVKKELSQSGVEFKAENIKEGVMVETPAAVMLIRELLKEVDFINIGSNDLLQYTLAAARGSKLAERRYHILHPSLVKLLEIIVKEGQRAKKEVCLCGEIASFEEFYPLLLQIGIRSFSVAVSKFMDIKCELLHLQEEQSPKVVTDFYKVKSKEEADRYFEKFI